MPLGCVAAMLGACGEDVPQDYGQPVPGLSRLGPDDISRIKNSGFARLQLTQLPTDAAVFGLEKSIAGAMLASKDEFPPLTVEMVLPGRSLTVRTETMVVEQDYYGPVNCVKWFKSYGSLEEVRDGVMAQADVLGFPIDQIRHWYNSQKKYPLDRIGIAKGLGKVGVPTVAEMIRGDTAFNVLYTVDLDSSAYSVDQLNFVKSFPAAKVMFPLPESSNLRRPNE